MSSFLVNTMKLSFGNVTAQVISLVAVPIITRLFLPEDYALFAIFVTVTSLIFPVSTLRFNAAMMLPNRKHDAQNLLYLSLASVFIVSLAVMLFWLVADSFYELEALPFFGVMAQYLWLVPLGVLVRGVALSAIFWALREKEIGRMVVARISESLSDKVFVLFVGYFTNLGALGLIWGNILGASVSLFYLIRRTIGGWGHAFVDTLSFFDMRRLAVRYKEFPLFSSPSFLVNRLSLAIPILLFPLFFSPIVTGFYALTVQVVRIPMNLIGDSLAKVFLQRATSDFEKGFGLATDTKKIFSYLLYLSLPPFLLLLIFGEELFGFVFGIEWSKSGLYAKYLCISFLGMFICKPLSSLFDAFERQKQRLLFDIVMLVVRTSSIFIFVYLGFSVDVTLLALNTCTSVIFLCMFIYLFGLIGINYKVALSMLIKKVIMMAPFLLGVMFCKSYLYTVPIVATFFLVGFLLLQFLTIIVFDPDVRVDVWRNIHTSKC